MSRVLLFASLLCLSSAKAADVGELLWEPGMKAMPGSKLAFPGAPKHGQAAAGAQRADRNGRVPPTGMAKLMLE